MLPQKDCTGCSACFSVCPKMCIKMEPDKNGFLYPKIDLSKCIHCNLCEKTCPVINKKIKHDNFPSVFVAYSTDEIIRKNSSSGGIFSVLAKELLSDGGVICGAALSDDLTVIHSFATGVNELQKLQGSKYVQSEIGDCFRKTKEYLKNGTKVLFSGTPCQIEGLYAFLNQEYENLYTIDIICHGVPSEKVFKSYLNWQKRQKKSEPIKVSFRDKTTGWAEFSMKIDFSDHETEIQTLKKDYYLISFLNNLCLRECCYSCHFKTLSRISDITVGDAWGLEDFYDGINDDKGFSLLAIHSEKGKKLVEQCASEMILSAVDAEKAFAHNSAMQKSVYRHPMRDYFLYKLGRKEFNKLTMNALSPNVMVRLERKLLKLINKL